MKLATYRACSRGFAAAIASGAPHIQSLLGEMSREIKDAMRRDTTCIALGLENQGRWIVGTSERHAPYDLSTRIATSLVESDGARRKLIVRDSAIGRCGSWAQAPRREIAIGFEIDLRLSPGRSGALWCGLENSAIVSAPMCDELRVISDAVEVWFVDNVEAVLGVLELRNSCASFEKRYADAISLLHDTKAPLSALRHLLDSTQGNRTAIDSRIEEEMGYLLDLLVCADPRTEASLRDTGNLVAAAAKVTSRYRSVTTEKGLRLCTVLPDVDMDIPLGIVSCERILTNLIGNAVRCTAQGEITVAVFQDGETACVSVGDSGAGMPQATVSKIQSGDAMQSESGWGVGLRGVVSLVESAGGTFSIESSPGRGTTITIRFPCVGLRARAPEKSHDSSETRGGGGFGSLHLCVVDDDFEQSAALARALRSESIRVTLCATVSEAVQLVSEHDVTALLCDVRMPDGGAIALLGLLRACDRDARVAVASGDSHPDTIYALAAAGARDFFPKPLDPNDIAKWLRNLRPQLHERAAA